MNSAGEGVSGIYCKSCERMEEVPDGSITLAVTSPPEKWRFILKKISQEWPTNPEDAVEEAIELARLIYSKKNEMDIPQDLLSLIKKCI